MRSEICPTIIEALEVKGEKLWYNENDGSVTVDGEMIIFLIDGRVFKKDFTLRLPKSGVDQK